MSCKTFRVSTRDHRLEHKNYKVRIIFTQKSFGIFVVWRTQTGQPFAHLLRCPLFYGFIDCIHCELKNLDTKRSQSSRSSQFRTLSRWLPKQKNAHYWRITRKLSSSLSVSKDRLIIMIGGKFAPCQFSFRFAYPNVDLVTIHSV